ncbi:hypothetical protein H0X48_00985 [Candidatus Dependentiae bacterium]|nr:hypothetical protein [Candidatus Dependentiae bacterium]
MERINKAFQILSIGFLFFTNLIYSSVSVNSHKADIVIFSFDRPLQLFALLESLEKHVIGLDGIHVLYRSSSSEYDLAYNECFTFFKKLNISCSKQGSNPREDFKPLTLSILNSIKNNYLLFAVDDIIVKEPINLSECIGHMIATKAHGFYLRLGQNIVKCYTEGIDTPVPPCTEVIPGVYTWTFKDGKGDWGYPSTMDMTVYSKEEVLSVFPYLAFSSPNLLEGAWATRAGGLAGGPAIDMQKKGLFYTNSKIFNIPMNLVQTDHLIAKNMSIPVSKLLTLFNEGFKVNIDSYSKINNQAPHMEAELYLTKRV